MYTEAMVDVSHFVVPSGVPTPQPEPRSRRRVLLIIGGVVVVLVLLMVVILAAVLLLWRSAGVDEPLFDFGNLPFAGERAADESTVATGDEVVIPEVSPAPSPSPVSTTSETGRDNLLVEVRYVQGTAFDLEITDVRKTDGPENVRFFAPAPDGPFSTVRVVGPAGQTIYSSSFSIPTTIILDSSDDTPQSVEALTDHTETLIVSLAGAVTPVAVELLTAGNQVLDREDFSFDQLPRKDAESIVHLPDEVSLDFGQSSRQGFDTTGSLSSERSFLCGVVQWLKRPFALAQEAPEEPEAPAEPKETFKIVVANAGVSNATVDLIRGQVDTMVAEISPWSIYKDRVVVVTFSGRVPGCEAKTFPGLGTYPVCQDKAAVMAAIQKFHPDVDAVVAVANVPCSCGVVFSAPIAAVGVKAGYGLIAHELGHAVGYMVDEYFYKVGKNAPNGPNCFPSAAACEEATRDFPTAECSAGCNRAIRTASYRPASLLMHNEYDDLRFGPLEHCLMEQRIVAALGEILEGCSDASGGHVGRPARQGDYYGGGR